MNIFINTDKSPAQLQGKATGSPLSSFRVKRGAVVPLSVTILGSSSASGLRMGIKAKGNYEGELLILAEADSGEQTELGKRFDLKLLASSVELNDILDVGEGSAAPPASISAMTEFAWQKDGEPRLSDTLQTTIINDIIRLATEAPESTTGEYPAPDLVATKSWVNSKQATADAAGFVMLGTADTVSGKNVRPVGKTDDGGLATSTNYQRYSVGETIRWEFVPFTVEPGNMLQVTFHTSDYADGTQYVVGHQCCFAVTSTTEAESGCLGSNGQWQYTNIIPVHTWEILVRHAYDFISHLTADEHAGLAQLLANKDALLALLNN